MKSLFYAVLFLTPALCQADTFILKDGARLEGEVTGEMDGAVLVKTKYGSLTVNKADIQEQKPSAPAPAQPAQVPAAISSSPAAQTLPAAPAEEAAPKFSFSTINPSTMTRQLIYSESGVIVATETFDAAGVPISLEGAVKDGTYTEFYPDGGLKTVKSMLGGKASGTLKAFYPGGGLQAEAYYMGGVKEGPFKYFTEDGKLLMEAEYRGDKLNGWKKEYGPAGAVTSQTYYADDQLAEAPKPQLAPEPAKEIDSMATAKMVILARGERFTFQLNGKHIGKLSLDREFNLISQEGKFPDGAVKVYSEEGMFSRSYGTKAKGTESYDWKGKLVREFVFKKNELRSLRTFAYDGSLEKEFTFKEGLAVTVK